MERIYTEKPVGRKRNRPLKDYSGEVFGRLTAIKLITRDLTSNNNHIWLFRCACGITKSIKIQQVRSGNTSSCGCIAREALIKRNTSHGLSKTSEYKTWKDMRQRCYNKNNKEYANYGARGITVCSRWDDFSKFLEDMGGRPSTLHTIDRIDVNLGYCPENCRWADIDTQSNNKRTTPKIKYNGKEQTISQWCREYGIDVSKVQYRIKQGMTLEKALINNDLRKRNSPVKEVKHDDTATR